MGTKKEMERDGALAKECRPSTEPEELEIPELDTGHFTIKLSRVRNGNLVPSQLGDSGKAICAEAGRLIRTIWASEMPAPCGFKFTTMGGSSVSYGPQMEITEDISDDILADKWMLTCAQYGVSLVHISVDSSHHAFVEYGRHGDVEFVADMQFGEVA